MVVRASGLVGDFDGEYCAFARAFLDPDDGEATAVAGDGGAVLEACRS